MVLILAVVSALSLGVADYVAGETLRRDGRTESAFTYTAIATLVGTVIVGLSWPLAPPDSLTVEDALWGLAAGVAFGMALPLLMIGMARGPISVVAPVLGLVSLAVPAVVGPLLGDQLTSLELAGLIVAFPAAGMVAMHANGAEGGLSVPRALILGVVTGALLGAAAVFFGRTSVASGVGPALVSQAGATVLLFAIAVITGRLVRPRPAATNSVLLVGLLSGIASVTSVLAYQRGPVAVVAAIIGLAPGAAVFLAWLIVNERISRVQLAGFAFGIASVALFAIG